MSMAMHTVSMSDAGGGSTDYTTLLDMTSVLDRGTEEKTTRVLYADTINVNAVSDIIDNLYEISGQNGLGTTTTTLIRDNDSLMAATDSNRFYKGELAKSQFTAMEEVETKLNNLLKNIDDIYNDKAKILEQINAYNDRLKDLKKDCRITLLREAAHNYNLGKHLKKDTDLVWSGKDNYRATDTVWTSDESKKYVQGESINIRSEVYAEGTAYEGYNTFFTWRTYKIIKYWFGLMDLKWFDDPGFEKVEAMFKEVGATLPYDPEKILPKEEA